MIFKYSLEEVEFCSHSKDEIWNSTVRIDFTRLWLQLSKNWKWSNGVYSLDLSWKSHVLWTANQIGTQYTLVQSSITFTLYFGCSWDSRTTSLSLLRITIQKNHLDWWRYVGAIACFTDNISSNILIFLNKYKCIQACEQSRHTMKLVNFCWAYRKGFISIFHDDKQHIAWHRLRQIQNGTLHLHTSNNKGKVQAFNFG